MKFPHASTFRRDTARPLPAFDAAAVNDTIRRALASAGIDADNGPMRGVTETIRRALDRGAAPGAAPFAGGTAFAGGTVIDGATRWLDDADAPAAGGALPAAGPAPAAPPVRPGEFATRSYTGAAGTRAYKLYVPSGHDARPEAPPVPLVVMLHGCTQNPDDFAAGTRMNELAEKHGFLVAYPAQAASAHGSKCWNWFRAQDQSRDGGEPSLIAGITRQVAADHRVDPRRIYVAGLSAGAAMAVILGQTHPDLYAAVGAHSGLPYASAHDMPSAFAAMQGAGGLPGLPGRASPPAATRRVPTIVFHGDRDAVVSPANGEAIARQALAAGADGPPLRASVQHGVAPGGHAWRRTVHADAAGRPLVEEWLLAGAGHAWSGGGPGGSYADPAGPDASAEMLRFFEAQAVTADGGRA